MSVVKQARLNQRGRREGASREVVRKVDCNAYWEGRNGLGGRHNGKMVELMYFCSGKLKECWSQHIRRPDE